MCQYLDSYCVAQQMNAASAVCGRVSGWVWMERGVGYCEAGTQYAPRHIPQEVLWFRWHACPLFIINILAVSYPSHAPVILPSEGKTFSILSPALWCLVNYFSCCKCPCIYFSMSCIIRYNKNNLKNLTSAMYNLTLHFKARLFTISRRCCQRVFLYACLLWNWQNCQEWKQRTFLLSCDAH